MNNRTILFEGWAFDSIENQSDRSIISRIRREQFGETLYAVVKETTIESADPAVRAAADERMSRLCALGNVSTLLVPEEYIIVDHDGGFTVHSRMESCTKLSVYAASHPLSQQELVMLGIDLCTALDTLEKRGITHGDIRPEHIFISRRGGFKLGGFDVLPPEPVTQAPGIAAAAYMAPEVYRGAVPGARADVYALGMVLYRTLNGGRMPFTPAAPAPVTPEERIEATARRMAGETLPPPATGGASLHEILKKACAADPEARYPGAAALRDALQRWLRSPDTAAGIAAGTAAAAVGTAAGAAAAGAKSAAGTAVMPPRAPIGGAANTAAKETADMAAAKKKKKKKSGVAVVIVVAVLLVGALALAGALDIMPGIFSFNLSGTTTATTTIPTTAATTTTVATTTTKATTTTTMTTTTTATTEATTTVPPHVDFEDILATVSTSLDVGQKHRTINVQLACDFVNGTVLQPGEEFSYNKVVGPRTYERGFKDAKIYTAGEIVDGLGGGICQVSSTLYMAALRADLEIAERRNHRFTVAYTPLGEDATVVYGNIDFRFVNNTEYPIRIDCVRDGGQCIVTICGTQTQENKRVEIVTKTLSKEPYETVETVDETLAPGERVTVNSSGHSGYKTETYRVVYIDDVEVSRELENKSTYTRLDKSYRVGPAETTAASSSTDVGTVTPSEPPEWIGGGTTASTEPLPPATDPVPPVTDPVDTSSTAASSSVDNSQPPDWLS